MWPLLRAFLPAWLLPVAAGVAVVLALVWGLSAHVDSLRADRDAAMTRAAQLEAEHADAIQNLREMQEQASRISAQLERSNAIVAQTEAEGTDLRRELDRVKRRPRGGTVLELEAHHRAALDRLECLLAAPRPATADCGSGQDDPATHPRELIDMPGPPEPRPDRDRG